MRACLKNGTALAFMLIGCLLVSESSAQVYRCGKVYQDRPCEGEQPGETVTGVRSKARGANSSAAAPPAGTLHAVCAQRGKDSQLIVWSREGGSTKEKMLSEENNPAKRQLIADVYRSRGTATQVRARIEAECQAEMEEKAKALAIHEAMIKAGVAPARSAAPSGPSPEEKAAAARQREQELEQRAASAEQARCDSLKRQMDSIRKQQRRGGTGATMDRLNRQRSNVDQEIRKNEC